jgi:hypothetical protein
MHQRTISKWSCLRISTSVTRIESSSCPGPQSKCRMVRNSIASTSCRRISSHLSLGTRSLTNSCSVTSRPWTLVGTWEGKGLLINCSCSDLATVPSLTYVFALEYNCNSDILIIIPATNNSVKWFKY